MIDQSSITAWSIEHPWPKKCYLKMSSSDYLNDMIDILRPGVVFDANDAYVRVKKNVLAKID